MTHPIKIALCQINPTVGDISGNTDKIIAHAHQAILEKGCKLVIFPELAILGYPPEDLLLRAECYSRVKRALKRICSQQLPGAILVGHPRQENGKCFNSASLIDHGEITFCFDKKHLPNFEVFDEYRYFSPGNQSRVFAIAGHRFGVSICEDIWKPGIVSQCAQAGADAIICINASPFDDQKSQKRLTNFLYRQRSEAALPIFYVNCVGGQDELVFDGDSLVLGADGSVVEHLGYFTETTAVTEFPLPDKICQRKPCDLATIYQALILGTRDYVNKNNFSSVLLGLSGGIDSALTLAIAVDALGADRVTAVLLPSRYTSSASREDALRLCQNLQVKHHEISIEPSFTAILNSLEEVFANLPEDVTEENIQARCRCLLLMALANKFHSLLLTTGNKSEYAVGYTTLYGDMAGGFAVLKDVLKTQVYQLANYRNQENSVIPKRILTRAPSAELRHDQSDQESLAPYDILDKIIIEYVHHNRSITDIIALGIEPQFVRETIEKINLSEHKRAQSAPGIKVSPRAFGRDWRYPITSAFGKQYEKD